MNPGDLRREIDRLLLVAGDAGEASNLRVVLSTCETVGSGRRVPGLTIALHTAVHHEQGWFAEIAAPRGLLDFARSEGDAFGRAVAALVAIADAARALIEGHPMSSTVLALRAWTRVARRWVTLGDKDVAAAEDAIVDALASMADPGLRPSDLSRVAAEHRWLLDGFVDHLNLFCDPDAFAPVPRGASASSVEVPCLLVVGTEDSKVGWLQSRAAADAIPHVAVDAVAMALAFPDRAFVTAMAAAAHAFESADTVPPAMAQRWSVEHTGATWLDPAGGSAAGALCHAVIVSGNAAAQPPPGARSQTVVAATVDDVGELRPVRGLGRKLAAAGSDPRIGRVIVAPGEERGVSTSLTILPISSVAGLVAELEAAPPPPPSPPEIERGAPAFGPTPAHEARPPTPPRRNRSRWLTTAAVAVTVFVIAFTFNLRSKDSARPDETTTGTGVEGPYGRPTGSTFPPDSQRTTTDVSGPGGPPGQNLPTTPDISVGNGPLPSTPNTTSAPGPPTKAVPHESSPTPASVPAAQPGPNPWKAYDFDAWPHGRGRSPTFDGPFRPPPG